MTQAFNLAQLANNLNTSGQLDATDGLNGVVPIGNGGTGRSTLTANNVVVGNGTSAVNFVAPGTSGNVLSSNGTAWVSAAFPQIGVSQSYIRYSVGTERLFNTEYTNSTSRPILVCFSSMNAGLTQGRCLVNTIPVLVYDFTTDRECLTMTFIVPAGSVYQITKNAANFEDPHWVELR
jgi:hypothetical protein